MENKGNIMATVKFTCPQCGHSWIDEATLINPEIVFSEEELPNKPEWKKPLIVFGTNMKFVARN